MEIFHVDTYGRNGKESNETGYKLEKRENKEVQGIDE